jgi:adenylate cyclase class IV
MGRVERDREIARRRSRRAKIKKLRTKFAKANDQGTKSAIIAKVHKIGPFVDLESTVAVPEAAEVAAPRAAKSKKK